MKINTSKTKEVTFIHITVRVVAVLQAILCVIACAPYIFNGFSLLFVDIISGILGHTGNLSGVGLIAGTFYCMVVAPILVHGYNSALHLYTLDPRSVKWSLLFLFIFLCVSLLVRFTGAYAIFMTLWPLVPLNAAVLFVKVLTVYSAVSITFLLFVLTGKKLGTTDTGQPILSVNRKPLYITLIIMLFLAGSAMYFITEDNIGNQRLHNEESARKHHIAIIDKFKTNDRVEVYFDIELPSSHPIMVRYSKLMSAGNMPMNKNAHYFSDAEKLMFDFVSQMLRDEISNSDISQIQKAGANISYRSKITRKGYENLRANKYVSGIELANP